MNIRRSDTDTELFNAIRKNDEEALKEVFDRYWKVLLLQAHAKVHSQDIAEEIVQDLFMVLWDKRHTLTISNLSIYLHTAVRNRCLNWIRMRVVEKKYWDYYKAFIPQQDQVTENTLAVNELTEMVEEGLRLLPEKSQLIFRMNKLEGRSIEDIAQQLQLSRKAIEYHLTKSVRELRLHLRDFVLLLPLLADSDIIR